MKYNISKLLIWFFIFWLIFDPLRDIMYYRSWEKFVASYSSSKLVILSLTTLTSFFCYSLFSYTILYKTRKQNNKVITILLFVVGIFGAIGFRYFLEEIFLKYFFGFSNYYGHDPLEYIGDNTYYAFLFTIFGMVFYYFDYSKFKEGQEQQLIVEKQKMELSMLRSQINPHFLFNMLNNIYSLIFQKSDKALEATEKLSSLLRYSLYESKGKVTLQKELEYLDDYILLQQMRYDYKPALDIQIPTILKSYKLPPFFLIPFVENAFKHGELRNPAFPLSIHLSIKNEQLIFLVKNKKRIQEKDCVGGIGLENVKRRLGLIYENYDLDIKNEEEYFETKLRIPLEL